MGARAPTPITVRLAPHCTDLPQLVERPALGRNRCCGSSFIEHDGPADPKMSAGSAVLVENGPRVSASMAKEREPRFCLGVLCCCCCQEGLCTGAEALTTWVLRSAPRHLTTRVLRPSWHITDTGTLQTRASYVLDSSDVYHLAKGRRCSFGDRSET